MKTRTLLCVLLCVGLMLPLAVPAKDLAGVSMKDKVKVGDKDLVLNGQGLRKKSIIKVYVAGLYLEKKNSSAAAIIKEDGYRRLVMEMKRKVGKDKISGGWSDGLANNTPNASAQVKKDFTKLNSWMEDLKKGDRLVFTYVPGTGTEVKVKGKVKGTIAGKDFADALFRCWIGDKPPGEAFKNGLLGK